MTRVAYINGQFVPHHHACVHVEERGLQFADGVYEVIALMQKKLIDMEEHLARLERSLREISISAPLTTKALSMVIRDLVRMNGYDNATIYLQISRGSAPRKFPLPAKATPSVIITVRAADHKKLLLENKDGVSVVSMEDPRWARPDIKTVSLLAAALAKQKALDTGAHDAIFTQEGFVTEGSAGNVWAVKSGALYTHPASHAILNGITKTRFLKLAQNMGVSATEKALTLDEFKSADEVFWTSANVIALPIIKIDDSIIAQGKPGPITHKIQQAYFDYVDSL